MLFAVTFYSKVLFVEAVLVKEEKDTTLGEITCLSPSSNLYEIIQDISDLQPILM